MARHINNLVDDTCFNEYTTPDGPRFVCKPCKSRPLKNKVKHSRLGNHLSKAKSYYISLEKERLSCTGNSTVGHNVQSQGGPSNSTGWEEEENLNQDFEEMFLDRNFGNAEDDTHMEINSPPNDMPPPIEEFDEPALAKEYYDSDDDRELDWTDMLPEDDDDQCSEKEERKEEKKEDENGENSAWHPFRNKLGSYIKLSHAQFITTYEWYSSHYVI
ncbi:hypothetical protein PTTG_25321 [Puccinia triticina 1-1 BBBD Race 1]|uniref:Uncharacterized protein n=1 Tax=Puccinia triticina (isolate 1-1 / race 1 (BBBD)) TaxID=630390 RepID=A0A180H374_PUCT1|nr:hypothetical protein PTTG_25321 [Puccinia triticina 1-1 BBBD Race 1]